MPAAVVVSIGCPGLSTAATHNVPADYLTIQACIDAAVSGVDECVVAPGTYHETINFLGKAITLRSSGGREVTTIDATGIGGSVVTCSTGEGPDTVLDGFTITGGRGTDLYGDESVFGGGGMYNSESSPLIANCTFTANTAGLGGGMRNYAASPTVTNCTFSGNAAGLGGGMDNDWFSSPTVTDCTFSGNTAELGGGMYNNFSIPPVTNCTFSGNTAAGFYGGGGGMYNYQSSSRVTNCMFIGNTADYGGGMANDRSNPTVSNCAFTGNSAFQSGGGMFNSFDSPTVSNCTFTGNTGFFGGAMSNGDSKPTLAHCSLTENTAYFGGGMYNDWFSSSTVTNCTFSGNSAYYRGGGMYNSYYSSPTATSCLLWGNSPDEVVNINVCAPTFRFSDVQGGLPVGAVDGGGNIDLDPMFVRPPDPGPDGTWDGVNDDYGDLRLQAGSPCINAGDPAFVPQPGETDLEGHARVLCGRVDMGAFEFGIGDYDCNQAVNLLDFAAWEGCMTGPSATAVSAVASHGVERHEGTEARRHEGELTSDVHSTIDVRQSTFSCAAFDFDGDGDVDLLDFAGYQRVIGP